jgi:hypothetical protein
MCGRRVVYTLPLWSSFDEWRHLSDGKDHVATFIKLLCSMQQS